LSENLEEALAAAVRAAVERIRDATVRAEVLSALEAGDVERAVDAVRMEAGEDALVESIPPALRSAYEAGAIESRAKLAKLLGRQSSSIRFDVVNPEAVGFVQDRGAALIKEFGESSVEGIRSIISDALSGRISMSEAADLISDSGIGLTENMAERAMKYRDGLLEEEAYSAKEVSALVEKFSERMVADRAKVIAHTEVMRASREGKQGLWEQAKKQGLIDERAVQVWTASNDPCDECDELDGETAPLDGQFPKGGGDGPPLHPRCECDIILEPFGKDEEEEE